MKNKISYILLLLVFVSCKDVFEENIEDSSITILSPINQHHSTTLNVDFLWIEVEGADQYILKIVQPDFANTTKILLDTIISTTTFTFLFPTIGEYQWSLQAKNFGYETKEIIIRTIYIDSLNVTIDTIPPSTPILNAPLQADIITDSIANFEWTSSGADFDTIFLHYDSLGTNLFSKYESNSQSYSFNEVDSISYYWKVKSYDNAGNSSGFSEIRKIIFQ